MNPYPIYEVPEKSPRIDRLKAALFARLPQVEADRAVLLTESYRATEGEPILLRRAKAFAHILQGLPVVIREDELVVGSATRAPRSCQAFPEFSFAWLESEFDTIATREADPFEISEETKSALRAVFPYWKGKTTSELATSYLHPDAARAMEHNIFTTGNYFYNGVGHVTVDYAKVLRVGYVGILAEVAEARAKVAPGDADCVTRLAFLDAVRISLEAVIAFAGRYAAEARRLAETAAPARRKELLRIAANCDRVPAYGARDFWEGCQAFWFVQMLLQIESSGHSISPGRFDQYLYPYYEASLAGGDDPAFLQELLDCVWIKFNDLNKARDESSAKGFAGYSLFQNLIVGGQTPGGEDATNPLSYACIAATAHVLLPQPSFSVRVWNKTPHEFLVRAAELTRMGIGLPAYYNDEVIVPSLLSRGLTVEDARDYNIIGCVEPQKAAKTWGWHDAAFFNLCRPLELVFSNGIDRGVRIGPETGELSSLRTFDDFWEAYRTQMNHMIALLVNADNAIDVAHAERCPLPYLSSMVEDCIGRGLTPEQGGAIYNFTGPQGFGIANVADALFAVKTLVYEQKAFTLTELAAALRADFGRGRVADGDVDADRIRRITEATVKALAEQGRAPGEARIREIVRTVTQAVKQAGGSVRADAPDGISAERAAEIRKQILAAEKYGNDLDAVDAMAREAAYLYTRPLETYRNPRGGSFQAGLYPVSANVPLGAQTGATPDGRYAGTPVADGVSPTAGRDVNGPTAAANSVAKLDHGIASNGTLFNMKFHPSALAGTSGIESFIALVRAYFDQKGSHMQFNVVSRETLQDAQRNPDKYRSLVVRVAGYSALFTTLSKSLQDDIINRTEQGGF